MVFTETVLPGAYLVDVEPREDERGFFARTWCRREFEVHGLTARLVQCNTSLNRVKGTLRGIHYQAAPHAEAKLIRCTSGSVFDVVVDLRPDSPTYRRHASAVLSAENRRALYIPEGFGHGFLTLADNTEVFYQMSEFYEPAAARGARWNDPAFEIPWPAPIVQMSERDRTYPDFTACAM
jgi:dTDP-4-dehydrorhamnose 3,5-epimerase